MLAINNISGDDLLTFVLEAFDAEIERSLGDEEILNFFTERHLSFNASTYFNQISILGLCDAVFKSESLLVFISNLESKVKMFLSLRGVLFNEVINTMKGSICNSERYEKSGQLAPEWLQKMTEVSEEFFINVANNNNWLLILFLILMFFQETSTWASVKQIVRNDDVNPGIKS